MSLISDLIKYSRLAWDLREFLRDTVTLEQSKRIIKTRLQNRERNFLSLVQKGVYQNPKSPYLNLLQIAGCEFGDIESLVKKDGIESALQKLLASGIYLSWEEFKGKRPVIRGNVSLQLKEQDFDNPFLPSYYQVRSSGSRSAGTRTTFDFNHTLEKSYYRSPILESTHNSNYPLGLWFPILPSSAGLGSVLQFLKAGQKVDVWFTPVDEKQVQALLRDKLALRYLVYSSRLWGLKIPHPQHIAITEAVKIATWIANNKKLYGGCTFSCFPSLAVIVCQAARENNLDISGTYFVVGGEPLTEAKLKQIISVGASVTSTYFITEIGWVGCGCPTFDVADDVHLFHDSVSLITRKRLVPNAKIEIDTFVYSTLLPSSPKILLNVESDDYGTVETRHCHCILEEIGFLQHILNIRSFSKLTGRGVTIVGSELAHTMEHILPSKFGGTSTDYQLIEEEDSGSHTRLSLIINPRLGQIEEQLVIETILKELRKDVHGGRLAGGLWSQAEALQIKREMPIMSSGKILPLHLEKKQIRN